MLGVDFIESDSAQTGADGRVQIGFDSLLLVKFLVSNSLGLDSSGLGVGRVW
jgi:hypothetical protein